MTPREMWSAYQVSLGNADDLPMPLAEYFCDNQKDADICAELVHRGIKRATTGALAQYQMENLRPPEPGDMLIVTNWAGDAQCIIELTKVDIIAFREVTEAYAEAEGEGDKSLAYWQETHKNFFTRQFEGTVYAFSDDLPLVCEEFRVVFK